MKNSLSIVAFLLIGSASFAQTTKECKDKGGNPVCCKKTGSACCTETKTAQRKAAPIKYQPLPKSKFVAAPAKEK